MAPGTSFLDLPVELRCQVYEYLLLPDQDRVVECFRRCTTLGTDETPRPPATTRPRRGGARTRNCRSSDPTETLRGLPRIPPPTRVRTVNCQECCYHRFDYHVSIMFTCKEILLESAEILYGDSRLQLRPSAVGKKVEDYDVASLAQKYPEYGRIYITKLVIFMERLEDHTGVARARLRRIASDLSTYLPKLRTISLHLDLHISRTEPLPFDEDVIAALAEILTGYAVVLDVHGHYHFSEREMAGPPEFEAVMLAKTESIREELIGHLQSAAAEQGGALTMRDA